jgi:hypothetical protein
MENKKNGVPEPIADPSLALNDDVDNLDPRLHGFF